MSFICVLILGLYAVLVIAVEPLPTARQTDGARSHGGAETQPPVPTKVPATCLELKQRQVAASLISTCGYVNGNPRQSLNRMLVRY
jgi:hypothetical protein